MSEVNTTNGKASSTACECSSPAQHTQVSDGETASTSTAAIAAHPRLEDPNPKALNVTQLRERKHKKKFAIKKLEKKLELLDRQIKKFSEAEVTLDEMTSGSSAYMKEDLLKRKFVATWQKLCELQNIPDDIVIEDHDSSNYSGTPYPEINRRVQRLLKFDEFPDHFDICQLIDRCNTKYTLGISKEERTQLSRKVFKEVGKILKRSRRKDFLAHFGSHLTDQVKADDDPALNDQSLLEQLKDSLKEGEKKLEALCEDFVIKEQQECDPGRSPDGDSCYENEEEEEDGTGGEEGTGDDLGEIDDEIEMEAEAAIVGELDSTSEGESPEPKQKLLPLDKNTATSIFGSPYTPDSTVPSDPPGDTNVTSSLLQTTTTTLREAEYSSSSSSSLIDVEGCSQTEDQAPVTKPSPPVARPSPPVAPDQTQIIYVSDDDNVVVISSGED